MAAKMILFDLDGTLTDSGEGIMKCAELALNHYGIEVSDPSDLRVFVGPPLDQTFLKFGIPASEVKNAIEIFRSRYLVKGKFENFPYPGIPELLHKLQSEGHHLYVATSKPESTALEVMDHFDLSKYFVRICGATMDEARNSKSNVIAYLLATCSRGENIVMVGDTAYDVIGAKAHGIPTIGVSWGYGMVEEMRQAGAIAIADSVDELYRLLAE